MEKKIVVVSVFCATVILLVGFTPALASQNMLPVINQDTVPIEVTRYMGSQPVRTITGVSETDAVQIRQCLRELYDAQQRDDQGTIARCIADLRNYGIRLDRQDQALITTRSIFQRFVANPLLGPQSLLAADNISNSFCFFTAIGEGMIAGGVLLNFIEGLVDIIKNQTSFLAAMILLLVFLPLIALGVIINDLIPIRILMPTGAVLLSNGSVFSIGLSGLKRQKVGAEQIAVNLSYFTGLTLNIPPLHNESKPFTFVSGFAFKVENVPVM